MPSRGLAVVLLLSALPKPSLIEVRSVIPDAVVDLRYATNRNFLGRALYPKGARCLLERGVAERLARAAASLREGGFRLRLWDCYRPLSVQRVMWNRFPQRGYVADPKGGSNHNRGTAVDLSFVAADGSGVPFPTDFDSFSPLAHAWAREPSRMARANRDRLRAAMETAGFRVNPKEWWHYDAPDARGFSVLDVPPLLPAETRP